MTIDIRNWLSSPIVSITKDKTVFEAAKKMDEHAIGSLLVMHKDQLQGIITERDIVRKVISKSLNPHEIVVAEIMSEQVHTVDVHSNMSEIAKMMEEGKFRRMVVTENAKVIGMITSMDFLKFMSPTAQKK